MIDRVKFTLPGELKFNFIKNLQCRLPPKEIHRFLRHKSMLFHLLTFLWHAILNYQTLAGVFYILFNRQDLVNKTCGFGIQYITIWNQVIEQNYFNACLLLDILEFMPPSKYAKLKFHLKRALPYVFTSIVFPLSLLVTINFWSIYSNYPRVIDEDNVTESFFPSWVNHGLHTTILILTCVEKFLVYRPYPGRMWAFLGFSSVLTMYWSTCTILYMIGGVWPYPLISLMSTWQVLLYVYANIILGCVIIRLGESLNNKIWGVKTNVKPDSGKKVT